MATAPEQTPSPPPTKVEMPAPTSWPMVLSAALALLGLGLAVNYAIAVVGLLLFVLALVGWIAYMMPGQGHVKESLAEKGPAAPTSGFTLVERMEAGRPGYRFRVPLKVHPISAGLRGGIIGGLVMPIPTLIYGHLSGHGIWFPVNLLAASVVPSMQNMSEAQLGQFQALSFFVGLIIHATLSMGFGILYGVVLPTLPNIPGGPIIWGGVLMPIFWTTLCYELLGITNPVLEKNVAWGWFLVSQFTYGVVMSYVVFRSEKVYAEPVGHGVTGGEGRP